MSHVRNRHAILTKVAFILIWFPGRGGQSFLFAMNNWSFATALHQSALYYYILSLHAAKVKPRGHTGHGGRNLTRQSDTVTINALFESTKPQLLRRTRLWYYFKGWHAHLILCHEATPECAVLYYILSLHIPKERGHTGNISRNLIRQPDD